MANSTARSPDAAWAKLAALSISPQAKATWEEFGLGSSLTSSRRLDRRGGQAEAARNNRDGDHS